MAWPGSLEQQRKLTSASLEDGMEQQTSVLSSIAPAPHSRRLGAKQVGKEFCSKAQFRPEVFRSFTNRRVMLILPLWWFIILEIFFLILIL